MKNVVWRSALSVSAYQGIIYLTTKYSPLFQLLQLVRSY